MALEALKQYAAEQNQATQAEIDKSLKNNALKRPTSDEKGKGNIKPLASKENVTNGLLERLAGTYKEHQENIRRAGQLGAEINKGIQAGEPIYLQTIYGILEEPAAIEIERQEVEQRLKRLMAAYEQDQPAGAKQRIKNAIKAHQEKLEKLQ